MALEKDWSFPFRYIWFRILVPGAVRCAQRVGHEMLCGGRGRGFESLPRESEKCGTFHQGEPVGVTEHSGRVCFEGESCSIWC